MNDIKEWIASIEKRVLELEQTAHPPRDFVTCEDCKARIKEKDGKK